MKILLKTLLIMYPFLIACSDTLKMEYEINSLVKEYTTDNYFNGVILVSQKGRVLIKKAYGFADRELDVPMSVDMKFKIGSVSKPFTAVIILQLVDEGIIALDGKITDYVPSYIGKKGNEITIEQLLTHTSGVLSNLSSVEESKKERLYHTLADMVKYIEESDLYFNPGTNFHYSNLAYNLLAHLAEMVTNKSFESLLEERIFEPLNMNNTRQYSPNIVEKNLTKGYEYKLLNGFENTSYIDPSYAKGCGGLISNVDDLQKFNDALDEGKLISKELYNKMITPTAHGSYGYGWQVGNRIFPSTQDSIFIISHSGSINGFGSYFARIEEDSVLVVVLKNSRADTFIDPVYTTTVGLNIIDIMYGEEILAPKKSIARRIGKTIGQEGIDKAIEVYYNTKENNIDEYNFDEAELNKLGIELLFKFNLTEEALAIFKVNMKEFPKSYNTYDSYAYALRRNGEIQKSIEYYKKGLDILEMYPQNNKNRSVLKDAENAKKFILEMEGITN